MRLHIPEINWHNRDPIYSIDYCNVYKKYPRIITGSTDSSIRVWIIKNCDTNNIIIEFRCILERHTKAVNIVRFSPDMTILASAGDDGVVILWKLVEESIREMDKNNDEIINLETWSVIRVINSSHEDVYDLSWSPDCRYLIVGSVDNSASILDINKCTALYRFNEAIHYIQGVVWDPLNEYIVTYSADSTVRLYNVGNRKLNLSIRYSESILNNVNSSRRKLFRDESINSFFKRCDFSPDGKLLIIPCGNSILSTNDESCSFIFIRPYFNKPSLELVTNGKDSILVKFCKSFFNLTPNCNSNMIINLPYKMLFAIATLDSVIIYDTQKLTPIGLISSIHYSVLTDLSWSDDGKILLITSSDGFISIISLSCINHLLTIYTPYNIEPLIKSSLDYNIQPQKRRANLTYISENIPTNITSNDSNNKIRRVSFTTIIESP